MGSRLLVIDASLAKRLRTELKNRGRHAVSVAETVGQELKDRELLPALAAEFDDVEWTLVTGDDVMPAEHGHLLSALTITVATIDPRWKNTGLKHEPYKREVVHRWAHKMAMQKIGEIRRYSLSSHRVWTPLRSGY